MTQKWINCSTKLSIKQIADWKGKWIRFLAQKRDKKYKGYIFDWYVPNQNYQESLQNLYRRAYQGKVEGVMFHSINDIGNEDEQFDFVKRMQELNIPVFCLKTENYIVLEVN